MIDDLQMEIDDLHIEIDTLRASLREMARVLKAAHDHGVAEGERKATERIVAWLRCRSGYGPVADDIERGEHRREEEP